MNLFHDEMSHFLSQEQIKTIADQNNMWNFITYLMEDLQKQIHKNLGK